MKNQPSINPRERRAMLDSQYAKFSKIEDLSPYVDTVRDLIAQMTLLEYRGSKKDKASHYDNKASKLEEGLKNSNTIEGRKFYRLTPEQFNALPDGTILRRWALFDKTYITKIKGVDQISQDHRGGFLAWGFFEEDVPSEIEVDERGMSIQGEDV